MIAPDDRTVVFARASALATAAARECEQVLAQAAARPADAHLVVTGGRIGTALLTQLGTDDADVDWRRVHVWWGDERFLFPGDPERNVTQAEVAFLRRLAIPADHVHAVPARSQAVPDVRAAAAAYAADLDRWGQPRFDLVLLSLGPDGHLASLFPGRPETRAEGSTVPVVDAPKPPPERVSMTLSRLLRAERIWLLVSGGSKREALARAWADIHRPEVATPAATVLRCPQTRLFVDTDAWPARPS